MRCVSELFGGGRSCSLSDGLAENGNATGLHTHCAHAILVVTPDVAVVEPLRPEMAWVHLLTGADVVAECSDQVLQCAAVAETSRSPSPYCFMAAVGVLQAQQDECPRRFLFCRHGESSPVIILLCSRRGYEEN